MILVHLFIEIMQEVFVRLMQNALVAFIDSQSIKGTPESYLESGFDGGKLISCLGIVRVFTDNVFDGKAARQLRQTCNNQTPYKMTVG